MNDFVELRQYIAIILRRWWILLLGALLGATLGYQISQRLPPVYRASATLLVGQSIQSTTLDNRDIRTSEQLALTYAEIGQRQPILEEAVDEAGLNLTWQQLKKQVQFEPVEGTQLLEVTVEADSRPKAEAIADEIIRQLILLSPDGTQQDLASEESTRFIQQRLDSLQERIEDGQRRIAAVDSAMESATTAAEMSELQDEVNTLEELMTEWESNYARLRSFIADEAPANQLAVIEEPYAGPSPVRPRVRLNTIIAGLLGLGLALIPTFTLEYLDNSIKSTDDLSQLLSRPTLGSVGKIKGREYQDKLITALDPFAPASEAYRMIRSNIRFMAKERPHRTILVTSTSFGEGKSLTVANLAIAMAKAGNRTIIVDADLRRPVQHEIFDVRNRKGLTELIRAHETDFTNHVHATNVDFLYLLTSGDLPPNPSELLSSAYTERLLSGLAEMADTVILDGPPVLSAADAALLSSQVDGVVVVVEAGKTERQAVRRTTSILEQAGANVMGAVLNRASRTPSGAVYKPYTRNGREYHGRDSQRTRWWQVPFGRDAPSAVTGNGQRHVEAKPDPGGEADSEH